MKLVLLDRDGVVNVNREDYVKTPNELVIYPFAIKALNLLKKNGYKVALITNQSVVGRGLISEEMLEKIHEYLQSYLLQNMGCQFDKIFHCTDSPKQASQRRKPQPGMILEAMEYFCAAPSETLFIGDSLSDLLAAQAAQCDSALVLTGHGKRTLTQLEQNNIQSLTIYSDILHAVEDMVYQNA